MWGSCCFNTGDIKITLGTGSFLNLNTGTQCPASIYGLYPLVAWKYAGKQSENSELVYCMEGAANDTGSIIQWALNFGKLFSISLTNQFDGKTKLIYFFYKLCPPFWSNQVYLKIHQNQLKLQIRLMTPKKSILCPLSADLV